MQRFIEKLDEAEKSLSAADHIAYVTFPLIKDKRLLLKVILQVKSVVSSCINVILQREYVYKRIQLFKSADENLRTFIDRAAPRYGIEASELRTIRELFDFAERHKRSSMEFMRGESLVILSENMIPTTVNLEKAKQFLSLAKEVMKKARRGIQSNI